MSGRRPSPPADINGRSPAVRTLGAGVTLHRFFTRSPDPARPHDPIHFDRSLSGRFSAPDGSYGVLYTARSTRGAFAETFLREPARTLLPRDVIGAKEYASLELGRRLRMARLYGNGLARLGCTAEVTHGGLPYDLPQIWSQALHDHPAAIDGIAYQSRHDDTEVCFAIFDRAQDAPMVISREPDLDQDWFYRLMGRYRVGIAP